MLYITELIINDILCRWYNDVKIKYLNGIIGQVWEIYLLHLHQSYLTGALCAPVFIWIFIAISDKEKC